MHKWQTGEQRWLRKAQRRSLLPAADIIAKLRSGLIVVEQKLTARELQQNIKAVKSMTTHYPKTNPELGGLPKCKGDEADDEEFTLHAPGDIKATECSQSPMSRGCSRHRP